MKYYLWILGCAMNYSDAERISAVLESAGHKRVAGEKECDLFIVVSCSVRQKAIDRIYGKINQLKKFKNKPKTALTGCLLDADRKKLAEKFDFVFDIKEIEQLSVFLKGSNPFEGLDPQRKHVDYLAIQPQYESSFRAYVPISTGCNNFCSYCAVPYTRGREKSRPIDEILSEVKGLVKKGYKEITLLGQNVNAYGIATSDKRQVTSKTQEQPFAQLIKEIDKIPGNFRVYFYSNHPKDMSDELIEILSTLKHFPVYIHLPLQSGNDEILRKMNRHYTRAQYLGLVKKIRKTMPEVTLTTDVIVGFPGETKKQFEDTKTVMKKAKFDMAFLAQYSPRPGTASAKMPDDVTKEEKKRRENELQKILEKTTLENNQKLVGKTVRVLIDEEKPARPTGGKGKLYGRTEGYKVTEIFFCHPERAKRVEGSKDSSAKPQNDQDLIGQFTKAKIISAGSWKLKGKLTS